MSKKCKYHFLETHIIKYELKISERLPESGQVRYVVCTFCINYGKEDTVGDNAPRKKTKNFKSFEYPFRTDNYISHLKCSHKEK